MGWGFRKSINFGGIRLNLSQKGVGFSAGVKGFRIGTDSRGRTYTSASIPGTGLYSRTYHGSTKSDQTSSEQTEQLTFNESDYSRAVLKKHYLGAFWVTFLVGCTAILHFHLISGLRLFHYPLIIASMLLASQVVAFVYRTVVYLVTVRHETAIFRKHLESDDTAKKEIVNG